MSESLPPVGERPPSRYVIHFLTLRRSVGVIGVALPVWLGLVGLAVTGGLEPSVSAYYHTPLRDHLVGALCAIAVFLYAYQGPTPRDNWVGSLAGLGAVVTAFFPTRRACPEGETATLLGEVLACPSPREEVVHFVHVAGAAVFLLALAYMALALFTKGCPTAPPTPEKRLRNRIYRACGWVMVAAVGLIGVSFVVPGVKEAVRDLHLVFWLEAVAIEAFGVAWLTKGEVILGDNAECPPLKKEPA